MAAVITIPTLEAYAIHAIYTTLLSTPGPSNLGRSIHIAVTYLNQLVTTLINIRIRKVRGLRENLNGKRNVSGNGRKEWRKRPLNTTMKVMTPGSDKSRLSVALRRQEWAF